MEPRSHRSAHGSSRGPAEKAKKRGRTGPPVASSKLAVDSGGAQRSKRATGSKKTSARPAPAARSTGSRSTQAKRETLSTKAKTSRAATSGAPGRESLTRVDGKAGAHPLSSKGATSKAQIEKQKRKLAAARRKPNPLALKLAANLGSRRDRACAIRKSFSRRDDPSQSRPVLARLVGGDAGRAAEPRIKLMLTLLWLAREDDRWTIDGIPAATMALLFGLDDHEKLGAARVTAAIRALDKVGIVKASQQRGREPRILVQHEKGKGKWTSPVGTLGQAGAKKDYYCQLDAGFWANGWITVLSSRAVAALVILLDATWNRNDDKTTITTDDGLKFDKPVALDWWHISEKDLAEEYGVSRDLFDRGVNELLAWTVVESRKRSIVERTTWGERRWYRQLRVRLEVLRTPVIDLWNGKDVPRVGHSSESGIKFLSDLEFDRVLGRDSKRQPTRGSPKSQPATPRDVPSTRSEGKRSTSLRRQPPRRGRPSGPRPTT